MVRNVIFSNAKELHSPECSECAADVATQVLHSVMVIHRVVEELPIA